MFHQNTPFNSPETPKSPDIAKIITATAAVASLVTLHLKDILGQTWWSYVIVAAAVIFLLGALYHVSRAYLGALLRKRRMRGKSQLAMEKLLEFMDDFERKVLKNSESFGYLLQRGSVTDKNGKSIPTHDLYDHLYYQTQPISDLRERLEGKSFGVPDAVLATRIFDNIVRTAANRCRSKWIPFLLEHWEDFTPETQNTFKKARDVFTGFISTYNDYRAKPDKELARSLHTNSFDIPDHLP